MAKGPCPPFDQEAYSEGHLTPVYFGSAPNNLGLRELLRTRPISAVSVFPSRSTRTRSFLKCRILPHSRAWLTN
jgi:peptide chain release factor 3